MRMGIIQAYMRDLPLNFFYPIGLSIEHRLRIPKLRKVYLGPAKLKLEGDASPRPQDRRPCVSCAVGSFLVSSPTFNLLANFSQLLFFNLHSTGFSLRIWIHLLNRLSTNCLFSGGLYFTVLNVGPQHRSALRNIHLLAMIYDNDVKHPDIGWKKILAKFNQELALLETVSSD